MTCIKTGARVLFAPSGTILAADLYLVGNCCIIRTIPDALSKGYSSSFSATHVIDCEQSDIFERDDIGIFVVPMSALAVIDAPDKLLE